MAAGLYIHIPFCRSKCAYCDFYSTPAMNSMTRVVDGLIEEYGFRKNEVSGNFSTIYIGGGTPSALPPDLLARLVESIGLKGIEEFTMEVNPEDVSTESVAFWKSLGINRVSMGVQSLHDPILSFIGRRHDAACALNAIDTIFGGGIENISADLIYGLPELTAQGWAEDLDKLLSTPITHLSAYCLTWNEGTKLYRLWSEGKVAQADDELIETQFNILREKTAAYEFEHYEISNFAKIGFRSRHNSSYWNPASRWLGIGPSAHSFDGHTRRIDDCRIASWLSRLPYPCDIDEETDLDRVNDIIVTSLRTSDGLDLSDIPAAYREQVLKDAAPSIHAGHLILHNNRLAIPSSHWLTSDTIIRKLIILP